MKHQYFLLSYFFLSVFCLAQSKEEPKKCVINEAVHLTNQIDEVKFELKDSVYTVVEQMPQFVGGDMEMMKYISHNLKYPVEDRDAGIQGRVTVKFVVGSDGVVRDARLIHARGSALDSVFLKLIQEMPKWIPGKQDGRSVPVYFTIPLLVHPK